MNEPILLNTENALAELLVHGAEGVLACYTFWESVNDANFVIAPEHIKLLSAGGLIDGQKVKPKIRELMLKWHSKPR